MTSEPEDLTARLALLVPNLRGGGAERVALNLANGFVERGHQVDLVLQQAEGELLELLRPEVRVIDLAAPRVRSVPMALARYLRAEGPAGLIAFMWPLTVAAVLARMLARSPTRLVLTDHAVLSCQYPDRRTQAFLRASVRLFYPRAEARVLVSEGAADDLARLADLPRRLFATIRNPLDLPPLPLATSGEAERCWVGTGKRILAVGSLKPEKRHGDLVEAIARLRDDGQDMQLLILGDGPLKATLAGKVKALGLEGHVFLPGARTDPWPFYASADLFVLTSDQEGFGNVLVEALHAGLPVVSTDCPGGPREILEGGKWGRLVPVGDIGAIADALGEAESGHSSQDRQARAVALSGRDSVAAYFGLLTGDS